MKGSRIIDGVTHWQCRGCKEWKPSTEFSSRHTLCGACKGKRSRQWQERGRVAAEKTRDTIGYGPPGR